MLVASLRGFKDSVYQLEALLSWSNVAVEDSQRPSSEPIIVPTMTMWEFAHSWLAVRTEHSRHSSRVVRSMVKNKSSSVAQYTQF